MLGDNHFSLDEALIKEIILDVINDFCGHLHEAPPSLSELAKAKGSAGQWALDSLITYQAASYVATMFNLPKSEEPFVLFEQTSLDAWAKAVSEHIRLNQPDIVFYTSGTTGKRKAITHSWQNLVTEALAWITFIGDISHVYINVPKHHIYGFIWGALIPSIQKINVTDYRQSIINNGPLLPHALVVSVPHAASLLTLIERHNIQASNVVLSTAPCEHELLQKLAKIGFANVYHVYGSTETGGLGIRDQDHIHFQLRADLRLRNGQVYLNNTLLPLQDTLSFINEDTFNVVGRLDNAIQINGYNVDIAKLEQQLKQFGDVKDTGVRCVKRKESEFLEVHVQVYKPQDINVVSHKIMQEHNKIIKSQHLLVTVNSIRNAVSKLAF